MSGMNARELCDVDFFEWTQRNAELLHGGCLEQAEIPHIAEESRAWVGGTGAKSKAVSAGS